jgi:hypothetical protein
MSNSFVWVISEYTEKGLLRQGVSDRYIIPGSMINDHEAEIGQTRIWLVTRGAYDVIVACLFSKKVERFTEGLHVNDYLITIDMRYSFRIVNQNGNVGMFETSVFASYPLGISEATFDIDKKIVDLVFQRVQYKVQNPPKIIRNLLFNKINNQSNTFLAKLAMSEILRNYSLDEIWGSKLGIAFSPFMNFAYSLIAEKFGIEKAKEVIQLAKDYDPLNKLKTIEIHSEKKIQKKRSQEIDIEFLPIQPDTIYAREFIASGQNDMDMDAALAKTETAEKLHQEMLRDISLYIISKKVVPFESGSVDLMFEFENETFIIEIKSTNDDNLFAQCSKGAFQLAYYVNAVKTEIGRVTQALVIHKTDDQNQEKICLRILNMLATRCLIYDPTLPWPDRLIGLLAH